MKIKSLYIKNFRSFCESGEIRLNYKLNKPVTIFGSNNSGKSNFLKALLYGVGYKYAGEYSFDREDYYFMDISKPLSVSVSIKDPIEPYNFYDYTNFIADYRDGTPEVSQKFIGAVGEKGLWKDWRRTMPFYFIGSDNLREQFKTRTPYGTYTVFGRYLNSIKEDFNSDFEFYPEEVNGKDVKRLEFLKNLLSVISESIIKTEKMESFLSEFNSKVKDLELSFGINEEDFFDKLDLKVKDSPDKPEMSLSSQGKGFIFEIFMAFFEVLARNEEGSIFLINKPEAFLDEKNQIEFYKKLEKLSEHNQVIIISSSINFINTSEPRAIIKLDNSECLGSEFKQTYYIPQKVKELSLLEKTFPDFKKALFYKKAIFISDLNLYLKLKSDLDFENIFFIHNSVLEEDIKSIMNDFGVFTKFVHNEEVDLLTNCEDFLKN